MSPGLAGEAYPRVTNTTHIEQERMAFAAASSDGARDTQRVDHHSASFALGEAATPAIPYTMRWNGVVGSGSHLLPLFPWSWVCNAGGRPF